MEQFSHTGGAGIYIHIPFCRQACNYCNFHFSTSLKYKDDLLAALKQELALRKDYLQGREITTIYIGGGTPSLLNADEINELFDAICLHYPVNKLAEFTLEANPDDLNTQYLRSLRHTTVDRLSIGVQSFRDEDLLFMNRAHNAQQADYAIKAAQDAGISNLSIDLIYGTPGLTDAAWKENLDKVRLLSIPHFSAYALTVEEKTALHHAIKTKKVRPIDAEQAAGQFELMADFAAQNGYDHYEISNLGRPGMHAVHNTNYWKGVHYLGIGPAAHSFNGTSRRWNVANNALYIKGIAEKQPASEEELLTPIQHLNEYIMTSLRTMWGCDLDRVSAEWHGDYTRTIEKNAERDIDRGLLMKKENTLLLTASGKLFADRIAADLFVEE